VPLKVIKRDKKEVDFDRNKIKNAVASAINDTDVEEEELSEKVTEAVYDKLRGREEVKVEEIQDLIEETLIEMNQATVAKEFILYRARRNETRSKRKKGNSLLSEEFLSQYKHKPNPFPTELGEFIYYRTYSRWLEEEQRREYWWETVKRAVEYNCSLAPTTREEAERLFDGVYNFRNFLAGRTLWTGGTEASRKYPMSNYNCAFTVIDNFKAYEDLFYLLLIGAGVGVRVLPEDVEKLPPARTEIKVKHEYYTPVHKSERDEFSHYEFNDNNSAIRIYVGDSKEAWVQALKIYFEVITRHEYETVNEIYFNYDSVRPKGERLKTFGGTASGHQSIKKMFDKLDSILELKQEEKVNLEPLDCLDIANIIGENVVSGGVRRTSEVGLFDVNDEDVKTAKNDLYTQESGEWVINEEISHRQMSNNSIYYEEKPSREQLHWHVEQMRYSGEPGFANAEVGRARRENFKGANPCFTGDMKLLTDEGYKRFDVLVEEDSRINVVNKDGEVTSGNVWSNGVKDIVEVSFYNQDSIKCTPDHIFMTNGKEEVEAKDMKGKRIMPFVEQGFDFDNVAENAPHVKKVEYIGKEEVYDFSEPKTHWGVVEGAVVHNCMEILLDSNGMCNLVSLNVFSFIEDGELNKEKMFEAQKLNARSAYRMALVDFELPAWDYVNKRDRLIGLSLTGWQDMKNALDLSKEEEAEILRELRKVARKGAEEIANEMNDVVPELVTTVKPEGTQTQMPTVSSGLHYSHSPYYIRRVRINADDPLVSVAEDLDWNVKNEVGQEGDDLTTKVIEFPVKAPKGKVKGDVSALEQLETYKMFMQEYVDHNASITVHVREDEWDDVEQWLWDNWEYVFGVSFLPYSDSFYDLMPYEECSKEEYEELAEKMGTFKPSLVNKYEKAHQKERELDNDGCEEGVCPVR
jgi:ribonucleotide reductase alpha subunit